MDDERIAHGLRGLREAMARIDNTSPVERALIEALRERYADPEPEDRTALNEAYAAAMGEVWAAYPDDPDVPLLLETESLKNHCDLFIFVDCPADIRKERVEKLRGWGSEELARRERHQLPPEEKRRRADVVFDNRGSLDELRVRVAVGIEPELWKKISVPVGDGIAGRVAEEGRALRLRGKADQQAFRIVRERFDVESAVSVPLVH